MMKLFYNLQRGVGLLVFCTILHCSGSGKSKQTDFIPFSKVIICHTGTN